jgi:hypothetical protein
MLVWAFRYGLGLNVQISKAQMGTANQNERKAMPEHPCEAIGRER